MNLPQGSFLCDEWSVNDVGEWLESLHMEKYNKSFLENDIDGYLLRDLSREELEQDLGIGNQEHVDVIYDNVMDLK